MTNAADRLARPTMATPTEVKLGSEIEWQGIRAGDMTRDELLCMIYQMDQCVVQILSTKAIDHGR